jgi:hypothetical protein
VLSSIANLIPDTNPRPSNIISLPVTNLIPNTDPRPSNGNPIGNATNYTMNLSSHTLTLCDKKLLDLGLTFIPTHNKVPYDRIKDSLHKLTRSLKLRDFFHDREQTRTYDPTVKTFTRPSTWEPATKDLSVATKLLINKLQETTETILRKYPIRINTYIIPNLQKNLTQEQKQSIINLRSNDNIIIKPADKGGMVCVLNKTSYESEAFRQLNNDKYYKSINAPLKENSSSLINDILFKIFNKGYINEKQLDYLSANKDDKSRKFYLLPKIHKPKSKWTLPDMPEGRPIVGDCGTESRRISEYIDHFLKPLANKHPSYIKDTYDFIDKIRNRNINKRLFLVTGDVTALYTNMNIERAINIVKEFFHLNPDPNRPSDELLELLDLAMRNNDFTFGHRLFLQIFGTAMGKTFAPNLANLYLIDFDLRACNDFHIKPIHFFRFLDDIFFLWDGSLDDLKQYENFLNSLIPDIKITLNHSETDISFLDTTVFKHTDENNITTLQTKVFFKETDTHQLLHHSSFHPRHTFSGILKSQVLRFRRLSSFKRDYDVACYILFDSLVNRGYNKRNLRKMKLDIWCNYNPRIVDRNKPIFPIVIPYSPLASHLIYEWRKLILQHDLFKDYRITAAFCRNKNLAELLAPRISRPDSNNNNNNNNNGTILNNLLGCSQCMSKRCKACPFVTVTKTFNSAYTRRQYTIKGSFNCKSSNIVYLITCSLCNKQYVGETQRTLAERLTDHRSNITLQKNTPLANHFNLPGHTFNHLAVVVIDHVTAAEVASFRSDTWRIKSNLLQRESSWQRQLYTYHPKGINLHTRTAC